MQHAQQLQQRRHHHQPTCISSMRVCRWASTASSQPWVGAWWREAVEWSARARVLTWHPPARRMGTVPVWACACVWVRVFCVRETVCGVCAFPLRFLNFCAGSSSRSWEHNAKGLLPTDRQSCCLQIEGAALSTLSRALHPLHAPASPAPTRTRSSIASIHAAEGGATEGCSCLRSLRGKARSACVLPFLC